MIYYSNNISNNFENKKFSGNFFLEVAEQHRSPGSSLDIRQYINEPTCISVS